MKTKSLTRLTILATFLTAGVFFAEKVSGQKEQEQPSVEEIVNSTNYVSYYQGSGGRAEIQMTIVDGQGRKRNREFTMLRRDEQLEDENQAKNKEVDLKFQGEQKFYVYFRRPADVARTAFLVWKYPDWQKDDDRWLYSPELDLVKRISSADKRTSYVGSHFYYEDVSGRNIDADVHELVESNDNYYVLKNTPKDSALVEFAYYKMWIHRKTFVVVQTSYYTQEDKEYRRYNAEQVKTIQGFPTVVKSRMTDLRTDGYTINDYRDVIYNVGVPEDIFTERYLRRPPMEYLQ